MSTGEGRKPHLRAIDSSESSEPRERDRDRERERERDHDVERDVERDEEHDEGDARDARDARDDREEREPALPIALDGERAPTTPPTSAMQEGTGLLLVRRRPRTIDEGSGAWGAILRALVLLVVAGGAAFLLAPRLFRGDLPDDPALLGTPARSFVKADRDYALVDVDSTGLLRDAAAAKSLRVWDLDTAVGQKHAGVLQKGLVRLALALEPLRESLTLAQPPATSPPPSRVEPAKLPPAVLTAAEPVRAVLAGELALVGLEAPRDDVWRALVQAIWLSPSVIDAVQTRVLEALAEPVVGDRELLLREGAGVVGVAGGVGGAGDEGGARSIIVRAVPAKPGGEQRREIEGILDEAGARAAAVQHITADLVEKAPGLATGDAEKVGAFVAGLVRATLTFNAAESDLRRRRAADDVPSVIVRAHRGELVLRPGEIITPRHRLLVVAMKTQQAGDMRTRAVLGTAFFVGLLCAVVYRFGARRVFRRTLRTKDLALLATLELLVLLGIVAADAVAPLVQSWQPGIPPSVVFFAVPVALGAMTTRLVLPPDVALLFSVVTALLGGVVVEPGMSWAVVAVVTSLTGAAGVSRSQRRSTMFLAGVGAGLVGAFAGLTLELFRGALALEQLAWPLGATFVGGVLSGMLVVVVTPVVEVLFGYVTEQRLYKLADLNNPLLKDLIVHAPGTWHHSIRTAELAEAAARSVGASAILARVMALYHDVGKMKQPQMFAENQKSGDNPHDRLPPDKSAAVLRAHVADGIALALEHGLPRQVIAAIEEHHVDNLMESFYAKARSEQADVDAAAFRYEGRAPQSRESALVMLADQIEAASRNLDEPTRDRLCDLVDALMNRAITDDTLAECDLSLRDLGRAREALQRALLRVHRQAT